MFYQEVFESLGKNDVRYLVVGGVAMNLHGVPRMTYDLDLMIDLEPENIRRMWASLHTLGFTPRIPIKEEEFIDSQRRHELREKKNMVVLSFFRGDREFKVIDIFVENPLDFGACYSRRLTCSLENARVDVMNAKDLLNLKSMNSREQDLKDIDALTRIFKS